MGFQSQLDEPLPLFRACLLLAAWEAVEVSTGVEKTRIESIHPGKP